MFVKLNRIFPSEYKNILDLHFLMNMLLIFEII